jgi:hypothetical protein
MNPPSPVRARAGERGSLAVMMRQKPIETSGRGAVGFGCGVILTLAIGTASMTAWTRDAWITLGILALVVGIISWRFGDVVLEWLLYKARWFM